MSNSPTTLKVLVFAASLRAESLNRKLAALAARVAEQNVATVDLASMRDFDVSSYDGDVETSRGIPSGALARRLPMMISPTPGCECGSQKPFRRFSR